MTKKTVHILIVEDDDRHAKLILRHLEEIKEYIITFDRYCTLAEATKSAQAQHYDIALMDLNLPDCSGLETYTHFRLQTNNIPTIILSCMDSRELAVVAVRDGAQDYVPKDKLEAETLVRSISYAIERSTMVAQTAEVAAYLQSRVHTLNLEKVQLQRFNETLTNNILYSVESIKQITKQLERLMMLKFSEMEKNLFNRLLHSLEVVEKLINSYSSNNSGRFSKSIAFMNTNHHEVIPVSSIIEESVGILGLELDKKGVSVICESLGSVYMIHKDVFTLFYNLISLILYFDNINNETKLIISIDEEGDRFHSYSITYEEVFLSKEILSMFSSSLNLDSSNQSVIVNNYEECKGIIHRYNGHISLDYKKDTTLIISIMIPIKIKTPIPNIIKK